MSNEFYDNYEYIFNQITRNAAQCLACSDIIESKHQHDYITCSCGEISVDGGLAYKRRCAKDFVNLKELSESRKYTEDELTSYIHNGIRQSITDKIYSNSFHENTVAAAKHFRQLWYPHYEP